MGDTGNRRERYLCAGYRPGLVLLVSAALVLDACASLEPAPLADLAGKDRFARFNSASFDTHEGIDRLLLRPVARGYSWLPDKIQRRVSNFFENLRGPIDISNNLLQGKPKHGFSGIGRLIVNSTIGVGGLFDPASRIGLPRHAEDFGQTLAVWGVPSGPYIFLPIIGPTTARDLAGLAVDWRINPITQYHDTSARNSLIALDVIVKRSEFLSDADEGARGRADDEYNFVRSNYEQARDDSIFDGNPPDWAAEFE
jgi:phospholipid-binding lipoprotein MlaA